MNKIQFSYFPGGVRKCLTMSYDDGCGEDVRLAELFRTYGIKGTFHIYSTNYRLHLPERASDPKVIADFRKIYEGHEVSCHTLNHPFSIDQPDVAVMAEIWNDKCALEKACGYPVRGMSYPYNSFNDRIIPIYEKAGMEYGRTVCSTGWFDIPYDLMRWRPTCHHNDGILDKADVFMEDTRYKKMELFYVWGHSYEFARQNNWELIEEFCKKMSGHENVWYATNIQIVDYLNALKSLKFSANCDMVYNPTATDVWFQVNDDTVFCPAGKTMNL